MATKKNTVTLYTTEVIDGVKYRPGDQVEMDEADPIAIKSAELAKAAKAAEAANARRD